MTQLLLPPPEQRLCSRHGLPICPSNWYRHHYKTGCSKCSNEKIRSPEARQRRTRKWESGFISCRNHPNRRCNKCRYVATAIRRCASCGNTPYLNRTRQKRQLQWAKHFIPCKLHPTRRCNRSFYIRYAWKRCAHCLHHEKDGSVRKTHARLHAQAKRRKCDRKMYEENPRKWAYKTFGLDGFKAIPK